MSQTVDSKVVQMKFDNSQFESNVKTSLNSLAQLKTSLNMDGVADSLSDVNTAIKNVDMSTLGDSVDEVQCKFSTLDVIATTALVNITNSAINVGKSLLSSLSSMFVQGGWERAANLEQAEFQLKGLGMDVDAVMANAKEAVLDTAYGLDSAAKAAAMFGASGMEAGDEMTSALRAIAGVAAMTGDSYDNIANIFTTVAGNGKLMTIQLHELANRGLNAAATLADYLGVTESEVRDMVSAGLIDFETFYTAMDEAFGEHAKSANETFTGALSNMKAALSRFSADFFTPFREDMRDIINAMTPVIDNLHTAFTPAIEKLNSLMSSFAENTVEKLGKFADYIANFKMEDKTVENLKDTFKGLWSILDLVKQAISAVVKVLGELLSFLAPVGRAIVSVTGTIGRWITKLDEMVKSSEVFTNAASKIIEALEKFKSKLGDIKERISDSFSTTPLELFQAALSRLKMWSSPIINAFRKLKESITSAFSNFNGGPFISFFQSLGKACSNALVTIIEKLGNGISKFIELLGNADFSGIIDLFAAIGSAGIFVSMAKFANNIEKFTKSLSSGTRGFLGIFTQFKNVLKGYQKELKAKSLVTIASAIAILAGAVIALTLVDSKRLAAAVSAIGGLFGELVGATALLGKIKWNKSIKSMASLVTLTGAITKLAKSCVMLGDLDWNGIAKGLAGTEALLLFVIEFLALLNKSRFNTETKGLLTTAISMVVLAQAIKMLASVATSLSGMSWNDLAKGLVGVGALLAGIFGFLEGMNSMNKVSIDGVKSYNLIGIASSIVILAAGIKILQSAVTKMGGMSWNDLAKGLVGVMGLLTSITVFLKVVNSMYKVSTKGASSYNLIAVASSIVILAAGIKILQNAVVKLSELSWNELAKGLSGVGGLLLEIGVFLKAVNSMGKREGSRNLIAVASSIVILAAGIKILQSAVVKFSGMSWEEIAKGLTTLGGVLVEVAVSLKILSDGAVLKGASAILVVSMAMLVFAPVMKILGSMSWESIAKGLITIAGALTILGVAATIISGSGLTLALVGLAGAFTLLGVGSLLLASALVVAGVGLTSISAGITAFATAMTVSGAEIVAGISAIILGIVNLVPEIISGFINGVMSVWDSIVNFIIQIVLGIIDVIKSTVPALVDGILEVIVEVCNSIAQYAPQILDALMTVIEAIVDALVEKLPEIVPKLKEMVSAIFNGIFENMDAKGLLEFAASIAIIVYIVEKIDHLKINLKSAAVTVAKLGVLIVEMSAIFALIGQLTRIPGFEDGLERAASLMEGLGTAIGSFIGGIVGGIATGVADALPQIGSDLSDFMENLQPFIEGASQIDASLATSIGALSKAILTITAAEVLNGITSFLTGGSSIAEFGEELASFGEAFATYADEVKDVDADVVTSSAAAAESLSAFAKGIPNRGGLAALFAGENSLKKFGKQLAEFGVYFAEYAKSVNGIDPDVVTASASAAESLSAFANKLPKQGGILEIFTGRQTSMDQFGAQLVAFGRCFKKYAKEISGINSDSVEASETVVNIINALYSTDIDAEMNGFFKVFKRHEADIEELGKGIKKFAKSIKKYAKNIVILKGEKYADVEEATNTAVNILQLLYSNDIKAEKTGFFGYFRTHTADLTELGDMAAVFADAMGAYVREINIFTKDKFSGVKEATQEAVDIVEMLYSMDVDAQKTGFFGYFRTHEADLEELGVMAAVFAGAMDAYVREINIFTKDKFSGVKEATQEAVDIVEMLYSMDVDAQKTGFFGFLRNHEADLSEIGQLANGFATNMKAYAEAIVGFGYDENTLARVKTATEGSIEVIKAIYSDEMLDIDVDRGGLVGFITGNQANIKQLSGYADVFATNMADYSQSIVDGFSGINTTDVIAATNDAVQIITALYSDDMMSIDEETPGLLGYITGHQMTLRNFGKQAKNFADSMKDYAENILGLNSYRGVLAATDLATQVMVSLTSVELSEKTSGLFGFIGSHETTIEDFGKQAKNFADSMKGYAENIVALNDYDAGDLTNATGLAVSIMQALTSVTVSEGGFLDYICTRDITTLSDDLACFANAIKDYATEISGFGSGEYSDVLTATNRAVDVMEKLSSLNITEETPGLLGYISGHKETIDDFAENAASFAGSMVDYAGAIIGLNDYPSILTATNRAVDVMDKLVGVDISNGYGLLDYICGPEVLGLEDNLETFALAIKGYANAIDGLDETDASGNTLRAASILTQLAEVGLPESNGYTSLEDFAKQMESFGTSMVTYSENISGLDVEAIKNSESSVSYIVSIARRINSIDDISNVEDFATNIVIFGESLQTFCNYDFDSEKMSSVAAGMTDLANTLSSISDEDIGVISEFSSTIATLGDTSLDGFIESISNAASDAEAAMRDVISAALDTVSNSNGDFNDSGESIVSQLILGVQGKIDDVKDAFTSNLAASVTAIRDYYSSFYSAGQYLVKGFANGISDNTYLATAKSKAMAKSAAEAAEKELDEHSPSKVGHRIGDFFGLGFVNGIADNVKRAFDVGTEIASVASSSLRSAISKVADMVNEDIDVQPTITPVIDLTNVKDGIASIGNMLSDQERRLVVDTNRIGMAANSMRNREIQNDYTNELLQAIKRLDKHMTDRSGDTYNVNGITYDDGSNISEAVSSLVHAVKIGRRS